MRTRADEGVRSGRWRPGAALLLSVACSGTIKHEGGAGASGATAVGGGGQSVGSGASSGGSGGTATGLSPAGSGGVGGDSSAMAGSATAGIADRGLGGTQAAGGNYEVAGSAGSAGYLVAGAPSNLGHSCLEDSDCTRGICGASKGGTCVLPCTNQTDIPANQAGYYAPCAAGETCRGTFVGTRCFRSCSLTDPTSCGVGYGCAQTFTGPFCLPVGTAAAGETCSHGVTNTGCKDTGFTCDGSTCRMPCDHAAENPVCPSGQVCERDVCVALAEANPTQLGERCAPSGGLCASDGKVFKGYCSQGVCTPLAP